MKFFYTFIILCLSLLHAVDIEIKNNPDSYKATPKEISMLQSRYLLQRIQIDSDAAADVIQENRYLSQEYLKTNEVPIDVMINMKLEFEKYLALEVIKEIQKKVSIDDEVLMSYYVANKKEFYQPQKIDLDIYRFDNFENALSFYKQFENSQNNIEEYAKEHNLSFTSQETELPRLNRMFQDMIKYKNKKIPFLLAPQFFYDHYSVLYIKKSTQSGIKSFDDVKKKIKSKLYEESFNKMKKELLKPYKEAEEK